MLDYLNSLSVKELATLVCSFFVGFTWLGALFIRPFLQAIMRPYASNNQVIGSFVSMYGMFYGILMGLLAVAAYQNKIDVEMMIQSEGTALMGLFRNATSYPETVRVPLQESVRDYTRFVIEHEWPKMNKGQFPRGGKPLIDDLQSKITRFEPKTNGQFILHTETTRQFYEFLQLRAARLYNSTSGIPKIMWFVVILGAFLSIFLIWMFTMSLMSNLVLGGLLSFFIGTMISLIIILDRPLRGDSGISAQGFQLLLKFMNDVLGRPAG